MCVLSDYPSGKLLSNWPPKHCRFKRRVAPPIDPEVLDNMRMQHFVGHAPKPPHILSNQVPYDLEKDRWDSVPESPMMRGKLLTKYMHILGDMPGSHDEG